mmetsp:Transcript_57163/g.134547  ORF Transcript_57163/g.134547 Transcript_57163/m.134547 type:complete len:224 (+) Transcript_57163:168-839(+)
MQRAAGPPPITKTSAQSAKVNPQLKVQTSLLEWLPVQQQHQAHYCCWVHQRNRIRCRHPFRPQGEPAQHRLNGRPYPGAANERQWLRGIAGEWHQRQCEQSLPFHSPAAAPLRLPAPVNPQARRHRCGTSSHAAPSQPVSANGTVSPAPVSPDRRPRPPEPKAPRLQPIPRRHFPRRPHRHWQRFDQPTPQAAHPYSPSCRPHANSSSAHHELFGLAAATRYH